MTIAQLKTNLKPMLSAADVKRYKNSYAEANGKIIALNLTGNDKLTSLVLDESASDLEFLYLSYNPSLSEVKIEAPLPHLELLYLNNCAIQHFSIQYKCLKLKQLYIEQQGFQEKKDDNKEQGQLQTLHIESGTCPVLQFIEASNNQLRSFNLGSGFSNVAYLYLRYNALETVQFSSLPALNILDLRGNQLEVLPFGLSRIESMETLYLQGNNLNSIDREQWDFDGNAWERIQGYLSSIEQIGVKTKPLHEAKLILIGNGCVGKSSIRIKLIDEKGELPDIKDRTPGLKVEPYLVPNLQVADLPSPIDFKFNIWDFGGQGRYREVQQLFCSRKSLYLYVTSPDDTLVSNESYIGYEYWLSMANAFSTDNDNASSPIIFVQNKCELQKMRFNEQDIIDKGFDNIKDFIAISCLKLENFASFRTLINESIANISPDIFTAQYAESWLLVKDELEQLKPQNHITRAKYEEICNKHGLSDIQQQEWLETLDRIGTVIYFGKNEQLKDWIILNPDWVKTAVCDIIDFKFYDEIAVLLPKFLPEIWKNHNEEERNKLKALLLAYHFCYEENGKFIVPALFTETKPPMPDYLTYDFKLELQYTPYLPAGTLHKFMVKLHKDIYNTLRWKHGVVLHDATHNTYAEIVEDWQNYRLQVQLKGNVNQLNDLWQKIYNTLSDLNNDLKNTKAMRGLDFSVFGECNGKWLEKSFIEDYHKKEFGFLFGVESIGRSGKGHSEDFEIENYKPMIEVKASAEARDFVPFKEIKEKIKILFLSATPSDTQKLNTGKESRFKDLFRYFDEEKRFEDPKDEHGVNRNQFKDFLVIRDPHILHYGGHGVTKGIVLEDGNLDGESLTNLLKLSDNTQCVILNACNSVSIAKKIAQHIPYVIATYDAIDDRAAVAFAMGFYRGIVGGRTIERSFELGLSEVEDKERELNISFNPKILVLVKGVK
jgi:internalin A